ncbi:AAA family ATPase [Neorickettsia sp. 179522]|uniref:AAA family ATPase n=1 Tax=Neorickettsia sp. 179522 TaxID=1714371 RepID=UPI00060315A7|nr:AAA family ATPase [Neorickettsia sp. 179522]KYH12424.1 Clp protease [Neorickettsia sp. 179522]
MISPSLENTLQNALVLARSFSHSYVTLEHLLLALTEDEEVSRIALNSSMNFAKLRDLLIHFLNTAQFFARFSNGCVDVTQIKPTLGLRRVIQRTKIHANIAELGQITGLHVLIELFCEQDSYAFSFLTESNITLVELMSHMMKSQKSRSTESRSTTNADILRSADLDNLKEYCTDMNELAIQGKIDKLIDRKKEIDRTIEILLRRTKNNPIYVGEPGVGKTAIVEGLVHAIVSGNVPQKLRNTRVYALKIGSLLAGTRYRGDFEERIRTVMNEISSNKNTILFIDEIHTIVGAGSTSNGSIDAGNLLKPFLTKGPLRCIGATTYREYSTHFEKDAALDRRFQRVEVEEPSISDTLNIIDGTKSYYEDFHRVHYTKASLNEIVNLAHRYIPSRAFPDKAIDLMDDLGASYNAELFNVKKRRDRKIDTKYVRETLAKRFNIPVAQLNYTVEEILTSLEKNLKATIFDQDNVIEQVVYSLRPGLLGLKGEKPLASCLFGGSTGIGKTELAKQIAKNLCMQFVRIDMSEYMEGHAVSKLIGAPPGYVGHDKGSFIAEILFKQGSALILFDEIEKAHADFQNILLQILDYGCITDSTGKKSKFKNCIIVCTTNIGGSFIENNSLGFTQNGKKTTKEAQFANFFNKELLDRLDLAIVFNALDKNSVEKIINKSTSEIRTLLEERGIKLTLTDEVVKSLVARHSSGKISARTIERTIRNDIMQAVSDRMLRSKASEIELIIKDGCLV